MPSPLALGLILLLVAYLLRRDARLEPRVSGAVWIPTLWLMINGSRQVSQWIEGRPMTEFQFSMEALSDGNPIDKVAYSALILAGLWVLARRRVRLGEIVGSNAALALFLLYGLLSVTWSDEPATSLKRWIKAMGDPVMVLLLWTDPAPVRAVVATLRRCAYVLVPVSILFIKYYEDMGRVIDSWGRISYTGVTLDKNMFGYLLFTFGLFFVAAFLARSRREDERRAVRVDRFISLLMLAMIGWLLPIANSKTASVALAVGCVVLLAVQWPNVRRYFWAYAITAIVVSVVFEQVFSIKEMVITASERDVTLTGRTGIWEAVLQEPINPLIGAGYSSFWLGERLEKFWAMYPNTPLIQAHNGYIELYINLGLIGLLLIAAVLWSGLRQMQRRAVACDADPASTTHDERTLATFALGYGVAYLLYNVTEATFQGLNLLFTIFLILGFSRPTGAQAEAAAAPQDPPFEPQVPPTAPWPRSAK
jgi:exopolysaccharide production protein ExoQ